MAKAAKIQGTVQVQVFVDQKGKVIKACIISGHPFLREAAINAALKCKYKKNFGADKKRPKRGQNQSMTDQVIYEFKLPSET